MDRADGVSLQLMKGAAAAEAGDPAAAASAAGSPRDKTPLASADDADYDPHEHRQVDRPTNNFETLVHLLKCSLGTGILAMPQAFARAGLVVGALGTVLVGVLVTYSLHVLVGTQYALCRRERVPLLSYPEAMRRGLAAGPPRLRALARPAPALVDAFLVVYQLGICCVYVVFIAENLKTIVDPYYRMSVEAHMGIILGPLLAFNCIRNLKLLAPWSTAANLMTFVGLGVVVYYLARAEPPPEPLDLWGSAATFPLFFGTTLFALTAVGVVVALENNMARPKSFGGPCGVLNTGMTLIVVLYVGVGALGYVACRSKCHDSVTLDLPQDDPLAASVKGLFAAAIFISYGLQCFVPVDIVWRGYVRPLLEARGVRRLLPAEYALRLLLCLLTFVVAVGVPRLGLFISLFGALCLSVLGVVFPALLQLCVLWPGGYGRGAWRLARGALLMLVGAAGMLVGTYTALLAIVRSFAPPDSAPAPHTPS